MARTRNKAGASAIARAQFGAFIGGKHRSIKCLVPAEGRWPHTQVIGWPFRPHWKTSYLAWLWFPDEGRRKVGLH